VGGVFGYKASGGGSLDRAAAVTGRPWVLVSKSGSSG